MVQDNDLVESFLTENSNFVHSKEANLLHKSFFRLYTSLMPRLTSQNIVDHFSEFFEREDAETQQAKVINTALTAVDPSSILFKENLAKNMTQDIPIYRLLEVDFRLVLPTNTYIRALISSADVLHS
jgi:heme/copper-type cytochrome/quinol oxidase subunit 2